METNTEKTLRQRVEQLTDAQLIDIYMGWGELVQEVVEAIEEETSNGERFTLDLLECFEVKAPPPVRTVAFDSCIVEQGGPAQSCWCPVHTEDI